MKKDRVDPKRKRAVAEASDRQQFKSSECTQGFYKRARSFVSETQDGRQWLDLDDSNIDKLPIRGF